MTPDKARDLLDGTTPAYEWWADIGGFDRIRRAGPIEWGATGDGLECTEADAWLIAAAPEMAAMIAGMREEWGVSCGGEKPGAWWASREEADQCAKRMGICIHYPLPIVVVRRYVTEQEEA